MPDDELLGLLASRIGDGDLLGASVSYRLVGGMPQEAGLVPPLTSEETVTVHGDGMVQLTGPEEAVAESRVSPDQIARVFRHLQASRTELVSRAEARFPPDSVVGEVTLEFEGRTQQLYFAIEEASAELPVQSAGLASVVETFHQFAVDVRPGT